MIGDPSHAPSSPTLAGSPASLPFGARLRALRLAARLTQRELAARSGVSKRSITDIERGIRRTPQAASAALLADALGLTGPEREGFLRAVREERAPRRKQAIVPVPLPRLAAPLLGREDLVAEVLAAFEDGARLVTLAGAPGAGKSAAAIDIARRFAAGAERLVAWVSMERETTPDRFAGAALDALHAARRPEVPESISLRDALAGRPALLVIDAFEQVLDAAPELAALLNDLPALAVLVTSREALRVGAERVIGVGPLPVPAPGAPVSVLAASPAVRLVARAAGSGPRMSHAELQAAADIARLLDGLPLALELAGAHGTDGLGPVPALIEQAGIAALAHGRRDAVSRFTSMEEAIASALARLPASAVATLALLGVFEDGFSVPALAGVAEVMGEPDLIAGLPALVRTGLARAEPEHDRFRLPGPVRLYARQRLRTSGRERTARAAHARWFRRWTHALGEEIQGEEPGGALAAMDRDFANVRSAAAWLSANGHAGDALAVAVSIGSWLDVRGRFDEGRTLVDGALAAAGGDVDPGLLTSALFWSGQAAMLQGDFEAAQARAHHLRGLDDDAGNPDLAALALVLESGIMADLEGMDRKAAAMLRQAHALLPAGTASFARWAVCLRLGVEFTQDGDPAAALPLLEEALAIAEVRNRLVEKPVPLVQHGLALLELGRLDEAAPELAAGLAVAESLGLHVVGLLALLCTSRLLVRRGRPADYEPAARVLAAALSLCRRDGITMSRYWRLRNRATRAALVPVLGAAGLERAEAAGESLSIVEATAIARSSLLAS